MAVTDNLGRDISAGLDQSAFIKQMADSLRKTDVVLTKTSESTEQIASGSGKLPQEIADKIYGAFEKDIAKSNAYLADIKKFCDEKGKGAGKSGKSDSGMIDAITALGDKLTKHFASGGASDSGVAAGFTVANAHLAAIAGSTSATANACIAMSGAFLHRGSGYTHDIHCEAILAAMQDDLRQIGLKSGVTTFDPATADILSKAFIGKVKALGDVAMPGGGAAGGGGAGAGGGGGTAGGGATAAVVDVAEEMDEVLARSGEWAAQMDLLDRKHERLSTLLGVDQVTVKNMLLHARNNNALTAEQLQALNVMVVKSAKLSDQEKLSLELAGRTLLTQGASKAVYDQMLGVAEKHIQRLGTMKDLHDAMVMDIQLYARNLTTATTRGLAGGLETNQLWKGIWGEQVKHNTALHETLYITQGLNEGLDRQRQQYMKLGREASAVAETGTDILTYQKAFNANMKIGIKDANTLSRITRAGASLAAATGMDVAQTAEMFGKWNLQLGLSSNQMSQVGRATKFAAQATGLMGAELAGAVQSARELVQSMAAAATLTADAAGAYMQMAAATKKYGVEKSMNPILKALSSTTALYNEASNQTKALLFQAAATVGKSEDLSTGEVMNSEDGRKKMGEGMENVFNGFLKQFGKDMSQIDKLSAQEKMQLNLQLQSAYGMQLGEFRQTIKAYKEGTKSFTDKISDINDQLKGNLTLKEREALLDQKRGMELQNMLTGLTKLDEAAKSATSMADALKGANMGQEELRKTLNDTITNVNGALSKAGKKGDMIDPKRIEAAMKDPAQYRELLAGINAAEQKSQVAAKAAADPVLGAQQKMNELQAKVVEHTGKIAENMTSFLGPRGVMAMMLLNGFLGTNAGNALINKTLMGIQAAMAARGAAGAAAGKAGEVASSAATDAASDLASKAGAGASGLAGKAGAGASDAAAKAAGGASAVAAKGTTAAAAATTSMGTSAAAAAAPVGRLGFSFAAMGAALLPLIKVVAIAGVVILALAALFQGLQKAFENIGFDMSKLTEIGDKVWGIIKRLWNGLTTLLGKALIPVAHAIKFLADAVTWLLDKINAGLDSIGLGSSKPEESATKSAESSAGGAATEEAGGEASKINTKPIQETDKNMKAAGAAMPDTKSMTEQILKMFAWVAGMAAVVLLWNLLAVKFAILTPAILWSAGAVLLTIGTVMIALAFLAKMLKLGFQMMTKAADELWKAWDTVAAWTAIAKITWVVMNVALWAAALAAGLYAVGSYLLTALAGTGPAFALAGIAVLALALLPLAIGIIAAILRFGYTFMIEQVDALWASWDSVGAFTALATFMFVLAEVALWALALGVGMYLLGSALLGVIAVAGTALAYGALAVLGLALLPLAIGILAAIMSFGLSLMFEQVNKLWEVISNANLWGTMGRFFAALAYVAAWAVALGVGMFLIGLALMWAIPAAGAALGYGALAVLGLAILPLIVAGIAALMAWTLSLMFEQVNKLWEVITNADLWGTMGKFLGSIAYVAAWAIALGAAMWLIGLTLTFATWGAAAGIGMGMLAVMGLAILPLLVGIMASTLAWTLESMTVAVARLSAAVGNLPATSDIWNSMLTLLDWIKSIQLLMGYLDIMSLSLVTYGFWWYYVATNFADRFNNAIQGINSSFLKIDIGNALQIEKHLDFVDKLPDTNEIWDKMIDLFFWMREMQDTMRWLNFLSYYLDYNRYYWWDVGQVFTYRFNNAIWDISRAFVGIDRGAVTSIEKHFEFVDDLPDPKEIKDRLTKLGDWIIKMQGISGGLDRLSENIQISGKWWWDFGAIFTTRFNFAIWGISRSFTGIDKGAVLAIERHFDFVDDLPQPGIIRAKLDGLFHWLWAMMHMMMSLDTLSLDMKRAHDHWQGTEGSFRDNFNLAIGALSRHFVGIDRGAILAIEGHFNFVDDLPQPGIIKGKVEGLFHWLWAMMHVMMQLDEVSVSMKNAHDHWAAQPGSFRDNFNLCLSAINRHFMGIDIGSVAGLKGSMDTIQEIITKASPEMVKTRMIELKWWLVGMGGVLAYMEKSFSEVYRDLLKNMEKGKQFRDKLNTILNDLKSIMDNLKTDLLKNMGSGWDGSVIAGLPTPTKIWKTYCDVGWYIRRVAEIFPAMAEDVKSLKKIISGPLRDGDKFAKTFSEITGTFKAVMDQLTTNLLRNLGSGFKGNVVASLPSPATIRATYDGVADYIKKVAVIFPQMAIDVKALQQATRADLKKGDDFAKAFAEIAGKVKGVMDQLSTGLLRGLGGRWDGKVVAKLPTAETILAIWNDPNPRKGIKAYLQAIASIFPGMEADINSWKGSIAKELEAGGRFGTELTKIMNAVTGVFLSINTTLLRNMGSFGRDAKKGFIGNLPQPAQVEDALIQLENWLVGTARAISHTLPPMVQRLESSITPEIKETGIGAAQALQRMIMAVGDIFRRISVTNLKSAFQGFNKKTVDSLPQPEDLLNTFLSLETWMKALTDRVLPKLQQLTADLKGAVENQLNKGVGISKDFGRMVQMIVDIFKNIKMNTLAGAVRGFVKSWGTGLPPAAQLRDIMDKLVKWMVDIFGDGGPMKVMQEAMTTGPLSGITEVAAAIREHAAKMAEAMTSITSTFKAIDPTKAIRAIEKLQKFGEGGKAIPSKEAIVSAITRVQAFVSDASAALHMNAEKALGTGQAKATAFMGSSAIAADPTTAVGPGGTVSPVAPSQSKTAVESEVGKRLAGAAPPPGVNAANQQLGEIANNTRQMAEQQRETNKLLFAVLGSLTGSGGGSSGGGGAVSGSNVQPTSTPLFPRLAFNYNGGAQKRYVQSGS